MNGTIIFIMGGLLVRLLGIIYIARQGEMQILEGTDSLSFYLNAQYIAISGRYLPWEIGWNPYVNMAGFLMSGSGPNIVSMCIFSVLAWLLSAVTIDRGLGILQVSAANRNIAAAVMAFYPTGIFVTTLPLREPFQMLGLTLMCYAMLRVVALRQLGFLALFLLGFVMTAVTHLAMATIALISVIGLFLYWAIFRADKLVVGRLSAAMFVSVFVFLAILSVMESRSVDLSNGLLSSVESFQQTGATLDSRAQYKTEINAGSGLSSILFIVLGFIQFMVEPLPWRVSSLGDVVVFAENWIRIFLLVLALIGIRHSTGPRRASALIFLYMYIVAEIMWSLGTINWGTAARHHAPQVPLLLLSVLAGNPRSLFGGQRTRVPAVAKAIG